jgi:hypothetical protein
MSHVRKGHLIAEADRCNHLGKWLRRGFWHRHRRAEHREIDRIYRETLSGTTHSSYEKLPP